LVEFRNKEVKERIQKILNILTKRNLTNKEIAEKTSINVDQVSYHTCELRKKGKIKKDVKINLL